MTCNVVGCSLPAIASFQCSIQLKDGSMTTRDVKVCTEHEKAFEAMKTNSDGGFKN